jgi:protein NrfD
VVIICEALFILLDLGQISRFYQFLLTPSFTSLMTWMFVLFNAMLVIYALETFFLVRGDLVAWADDPARKGRKFYRSLALGATSYSEEDRVRDHRRVRVLSLISLPVGFLFYATNGAFFAIVINRPIWNSAMTPALFVVAAMLSGGALITFLVHVFMREDELVKSLGGITLFLLVVFLLLEGMRFYIGYQSNLPLAVASLNLTVSGPYGWTFWIGHLLLGSLLPLIMLIRFRDNPGAIAWACFLIAITFITFRLSFVIPDLQITGLQGLGNTFVNKRLQTNYIPNLNEWLVSLWVVSLGLLTFLLGTRWLPVVTANKGGLEHVEEQA